MATNELPTRGNIRGGPGWWMDVDGAWRSPEEWPEDTPPLEGWVRNSDGQWSAPLGTNDGAADRRDRVAAGSGRARPEAADEPAPKRRSRQAEADRRAMLTVVGAIAGALMLLVVALVLITQAGAEEDIATPVDPEASVIFAAETDQRRTQRQLEAAAVAPAVARAQLAQLTIRAEESTTADGFDLLAWTPERTDCLDIAEQVLIERSVRPIIWADKLECVPDRGRWTDRYIGATITRTIDADVTPHVPAVVAYMSGGSQWTAVTRQAYLTDVGHPATLEITSAGSGHNPRQEGPEAWKPSKQSTWCAYAVDWIAVKTRWELDVGNAERDALSEMLDTCTAADSTGADPLTMVVDDLNPPSIERIGDVAE